MTALLIALGAAVGAPLRYLIDRAVQARHRGGFPWGTLVVNVTGSLLLGFVIGAAASGANGAGDNGFAAADGPLVALLGTGFCGALTTYSTFGYETVRLHERGETRAALGNAVLSVAAASVAAGTGLALAAALWS
ncbi:fluoride efflux transporter FluC [Micromonosporaceae bacterium DT194]|uniref:fluoride efflux transporter FluC n=1 Tax=Melissospora conviva TaxID=3388432 RepID=UPI003C255C5E